MTDPAPARPTATPAEETIERHAHAAWRYLRMHGATRIEADDLTQEAFVIALQKGVLGADPAALHTFLQRTARFLFLRLRKHGRRSPAIADLVDDLWQRTCSADDGDALVTAARACIEQLEGRARTALELGYGIDGEPASRTAIAQALGMRENGVKTLMQRLRQRLRECIDRRLER